MKTTVMLMENYVDEKADVAAIGDVQDAVDDDAVVRCLLSPFSSSSS